MDNRAAELVAAFYARATDVGHLVVFAVWHVGFTLPRLLGELSAGRAHAGELAVWLALAVISIAGAFLLFREKLTVPVSRVLVVCVLVLGAWVTLSHPPEQAMDEGAWAWIVVGWFGVMLLRRQSLWVLCGLLAMNTAVIGGYIALSGVGDRMTIGRFVVLTCMTAGIQLAAGSATMFIHRAAQSATNAAVARAETQAQETMAEEVHASRAQRYGYLQLESRALLAGLADGSLDPGDDEVRRRCAIESARLRRLFAETDDVADPLLHELRACADAAERRAVQVDLVACGELPELPVDIRRALLDAPLEVLSTTASHARVTVVAQPEEVIVSVLGDAVPRTRISHLAQTSQPIPPTVTITEDHEEGQLWVQTHWRPGDGGFPRWDAPLAASKAASVGSTP